MEIALCLTSFFMNLLDDFLGVWHQRPKLVSPSGCLAPNVPLFSRPF
jgi:hypothetical protein